jgi:uncharacterized membrane protein
VKAQPALRRLPIALLLSFVILSVLSLARFDQSLWLDEGSSVWFARLPSSALLTSLCDPHPAGYYLFLKTWLIAADGEAWLRVPSLAAALLAVLLTYQIGKDHGGKTYAVLAAILLALHPLQSWYGSEVRMYAAAQAAGLLMVWLGWRIIDGSSRRFIIIAYLLTAAAAFWIDYTTLLPWGLLQLIWMVRSFPRARRWIILQALCLLPMIVGVLTTSQLSALSQGYQPIFLAVQANSLGLALTPSSAALLLQAMVILSVWWCLALAWYWRRHTFLGAPLTRSVVVGLWIALVLLSIVPRGLTLKRVIVVMLPYLALTTAYVLTRWPETIARSVIVVEAVAVVISLGTLQREPWRAVIEDLLTKNTPSIAWVDDLAVPIFDYYARRTASTDQHVGWAPLFGRDLPRTPELQPHPNDTLAIVTSETPYRRLAAFLPAAFYAQYELLSERREPGIGVDIYRRRMQPDDTAAPPTHTSTDAWGLFVPSPLGTCQP